MCDVKEILKGREREREIKRENKKGYLDHLLLKILISVTDIIITYLLSELLRSI
jgi:hypothetical protein